jgi:HSP20 family molecular chaperone IbpA
MSDLDSLLDELERVIMRAMRAAESGGGIGEAEQTFGMDRMVSARVSARVGFLDELGSTSLTHPRTVREPVIDVFEDGEDLKILVNLPGVRKDDIVLLAGPKSLRIEITKGTAKISREIPWGGNLGRARIKSSMENNSVVEITVHTPRRGAPR